MRYEDSFLHMDKDTVEQKVDSVLSSEYFAPFPNMPIML